MTIATRLGRRGTTGIDSPVELRFVDLLLVIIASLMFVAVLLTIISAIPGHDLQGGGVTPPHIATDTMPDALADQRYELTLAATGGMGSLSWRIRSGSLPPGLSLSSDGRIRGFPRNSGQSQLSVEVVDNQGFTDYREFGLTVRPFGSQPSVLPVQLRIVDKTIALSDAVVSTGYQYHFAAEAGTPAYRWALTEGTLPRGLTLSPDGEIIGQSDEIGSFTFGVRVTDAVGAILNQNARLTVVRGPFTVWQRIQTWLWRAVFGLGVLEIAVLVYAFLFGIGPTRGTTGWLQRHGIGGLGK